MGSRIINAEHDCNKQQTQLMMTKIGRGGMRNELRRSKDNESSSTVKTLWPPSLAVMPLDETAEELSTATIPPLLVAVVAEEEGDDDAIVAIEETDVAAVCTFICVADTVLCSMLDWVNVVILCCEVPAEFEPDKDDDDEDEEDAEACACVILPVEVDVANCDAAIVSRFNAADCFSSSLKRILIKVLFLIQGHFINN
ncbi:hypothetical protein FF38_09912 [Lucilia cuprina]|uniref:Uncharacterized protein n=1 Tax=Lucilia cuprina TaxID=7375 RepID=A0A0L0BZG6_LUCCU|nr:hypothetical protein FF38_09912 [Lucilia cuprina]